MSKIFEKGIKGTIFTALFCLLATEILANECYTNKMKSIFLKVRGR